jgi:hypothetical protein
LEKSRLIIKNVPFYWAFIIGLLVVVAQVVTFYVRFGRWNTDAFFVDYLLIFIAGALGGLILIYFQNRQPSADARFIVLIAFLLASPLALIMMIAGGLIGVFGILLFPQIPWALFTWVGSLLARIVSRA